MSGTLKSATMPFLYWFLGTWVVGSLLWTTAVTYLVPPWDSSPVARIAGMILLVLIGSLPITLIGSFCVTILRELIRRVLTPGWQKVAMVILSMALGYVAVARVEPDFPLLHGVGLIAAGCGELLVLVALGARKTGTSSERRAVLWWLSHLNG